MKLLLTPHPPFGHLLPSKRRREKSGDFDSLEESEGDGRGILKSRRNSD
ncbi:hypothetical protein BN59_02705 [Legionella massiliensis]|uniref:Uncharacterized protein n=1 Tax=Legionella massiliensis TaxID=1034943 RepID=A0A078KVD1_9GAMM|nr:hypothetical protein BN59_02705 [Legionella massiliensis]CEE14133.1 hypothetical protein BN1094_02705 [Legionella massiliensis]